MKRSIGTVALAAFALSLVAAQTRGQSPAPVDGTSVSGDVLVDDSEQLVEEFLADQKLDHLLAAQLRRRIDAADPADRVKPAETLARLYVRMLQGTQDSSHRRDLEQQSRDLLERVPDADSSELRLDLAKATYLRAEELAERTRLRLSSADDRAEAVRVLQDVLPAFTQIRARLNRRVDTLEQAEKRGGGDEQGVRADLVDARRIRSIAAYYEGWTRYYLALLSNDKTQAKDALEAFGVLLNAVPGRAPSVERFPPGNLRFDHVARSVFGVSMCHSMLGNDVDAMRWLDVVLASDALSPATTAQVFSRQFLVLVQGSRWTDAESLVRRRRLNSRDASVQLLTPQEARLVAVQSLDALRSGTLREGFKTTVGMLARVALADLVSRGELAQIIDLVKQYGTLPIGDDGFIVAYVRGLQQFEATRAQHVSQRASTPAQAAAGASDSDGPATDPALVNAYRDAARLFDAALKADDTSQFSSELPRAQLRRGLALFYAGDLHASAQGFEQAFAQSTDAAVRQDALWFAVVSLDIAVERGDRAREADRDRLATLYVQQFPASPNATRLLIRQARASGVDDRAAMEILLKVPADSPLYLASRRHAARLLYQLHRGALANEKQFLGLKFADVAEELLRLESPEALTGTGQAASDAAESVAIRARQLLDVLLGSPTPDLPRAEAALATLEQVAARQGGLAKTYEAEMLFRRLQMCLARGQMSDAQRLWDTLRGMQGPFASGADQLLYAWAESSFTRDETSVEHATSLVRYGTSMLDRMPEGEAKRAARERVAQAAAMLATTSNDKRMRELAIKLDREQAGSGLRTISSLHRLATLHEAAGELPLALEAWSELLAGMDPGSPAWYEPRYHTLRLLQRINQREARVAYSQYKILFPAPAPEPWEDRIRQLGLTPLSPEELLAAPTVTPAPGGGP